MSDKILQMFFDIGRWKKAIEKGVLKDIRKDQLIRLTERAYPYGHGRCHDTGEVRNRSPAYRTDTEGERRVPYGIHQRARRPGSAEHCQRPALRNACRKWYTPRASPTRAVSAAVA